MCCSCPSRRVCPRWTWGRTCAVNPGPRGRWRRSCGMLAKMWASTTSLAGKHCWTRPSLRLRWRPLRPSSRSRQQPSAPLILVRRLLASGRGARATCHWGRSRCPGARRGTSSSPFCSRTTLRRSLQRSRRGRWPRVVQAKSRRPAAIPPSQAAGPPARHRCRGRGTSGPAGSGPCWSSSQPCAGWRGRCWGSWHWPCTCPGSTSSLSWQPQARSGACACPGTPPRRRLRGNPASMAWRPTWTPRCSPWWQASNRGCGRRRQNRAWCCTALR
mmetsp:Transcript_6147/g.16702  ORF Transcript_6147/g.16702 Transcript_6147/m.16702 type:complete len:272 (-) Transcript_6147:296-1111(-)